MIEYDAFLTTHGSTTKVDVQDLSEKIIGKRKSGGKVEAPIKRTKFPAYFISDLAHVVAFADERIPMAELTAELDKQGVAHSGVQIEGRKALGNIVQILRFPEIEGFDVKQFRRFVRAVNIRVQNRGSRTWKLEFLFNGNLIENVNKTSSLHFEYEVGIEPASNAVQGFIKNWEKMARLFDLVNDLVDYNKDNIEAIFVDVKSYNFKECILEFGPDKKQTVKVTWNADKGKFELTFNGVNEHSGMCPHSLVKHQLEDHLNTHKSLIYLGKSLIFYFHFVVYVNCENICR